MVPGKKKAKTTAKRAAPKRAAAKGRQEPFSPSFDFGKTVDLTITKSQESASTYHLSDGTIVTVRPIIAEVARSTNKFNEIGEPIYVVRTGFLVTAKVHKKLIRKKPKS